MAKIFFAVPFFSGEKFLSEAIDSLIQQSEPDWVATVIDDSGRPEGAAFVRQLLADRNDLRLHMVSNERNLGIGAGWNKGFDLASEAGVKLVTILHEDDRLEPDYVVRVVEAYSQHPEVALLATQTQVIDEGGRAQNSVRDWYRQMIRPSTLKVKDGRELLLMKGPSGLARLMRGNFFYCPSICYNLAHVGARRFRLDLDSALDLDFYCRLLLDGQVLAALASKPLFSYRRRRDSATEVASKSQKKFTEELSVYQSIGHEALRRGWQGAVWWSRLRPSLRLHLAYRRVRGL